jgi:hypothetical protein
MYVYVYMLYMYIYVYIYICACVCVSVRAHQEPIHAVSVYVCLRVGMCGQLVGVQALCS